MWHEARRQERRIRGMIVDYRKRAERRQDFYEKIQADPTQFIQIHGRRCKIHLDPAVAAAGDGAAIIVPWHGQQDNLIDRFDVRAHLDHIPPVSRQTESEGSELTSEERQCNYERYRILAQNDFLAVSEDKFLHQLYLEEQFGANAQLEAERNLSKKKQKLAGATIGYSYDEPGSAVGPQPFSHLMNVTLQSTAPSACASKSEKDSESDSESDIDMDVAIEVSKLDTAQAHELNACGRNYGMLSNDFYSYLTKDADEAEAMRMAREEEQEKMLLSGRKSRRERRAQKERRIACRPFSPPSYAAKEDLTASEKNENMDDSDSRSPSPETNTGKITYITSFGGEDELQPHSKISISINKGLSPAASLGAICADTQAAKAQMTYAQKVKENLGKLKTLNESPCHESSTSKRSSSTTRQRGYYPQPRSRSRFRYDSREKRTYRELKGYRRSRSRSNSKESFKLHKHRSRTRSRSRSRLRSTRYRRRYSYTSTSSSSSAASNASSSSYRRYERNKKVSKANSINTSSYRSRSRSQTRGSQPATPLKSSQHSNMSKKVCAAETTTKIIQVPGNPTVTGPMICYPLPLRAMGIDINTAPPPPPIEEQPVTGEVAALVQVAPPPPLKRYYGRKRGSDTSSQSDATESDTEPQDIKTETFDIKGEPAERIDMDTASEPSNPLPPMTISALSGTPETGKYFTSSANNTSFSNASENKDRGSCSSAGTQNRLNLRERLKRKMQNLLNKQYKADKRAEIEKTERERQLQQERDDEMRELALKLRRRQRELRHKYGTPNSSKASDSDTSEATAVADVYKLRRSKSPSNEHPAVPTDSRSDNRPSCQTRGNGDEPKRTSYAQQRHSKSRELENDRKSSRSRSRSYYRDQRRSRSRSRGRRSVSRRRRRSPSRTRRLCEQSYERGASRYAPERTRYDDRYRRSRSHEDRSSYRDRFSGRERDWIRDREHERLRDRERERERDRFRNRDRENDREKQKEQRNVASSMSSTSAASSSSRNRIVISAPPKLKKLVDY